MLTLPPLSIDVPGTDVTVLVRPRGSNIHAEAEAALLEAGVSIPAPHRTEWGAVRRGIASVAYVLRNRQTGRYVSLFCADLWPSRMFPGCCILRVERFGATGADAWIDASVEALRASVRRHPGIVRLRIEVHAVDPGRLARVESALEAHGFDRQPEPRSYEETGLIDLAPGIDEVLASLHATGRRHIRAVDKNPAEVRPLLDERLAPRIEELCSESYGRTGGTPEPRDWAELIRFSARHPGLSRISGLFRTDAPVDDPTSLLAFAWGVHHGDHVEFVAGGATRGGGIKMPLAYAIHWDLITWAKEHGATLYDMGGITRGTASDDDPVGGISDFKRYFNPKVQVVGSEYIVEVSIIVRQTTRLLKRALALLLLPFA